MHVSEVTGDSAELGEISPLGWVPNDDLGYEDWERAMQGFFLVHRSLNWIIGDGLNFGERRYGEMYAQAIECTGWAYQRLADAKWVAANVPLENRREALTWTHHRHVARLPGPAQGEWLDRAEEGAWTTADLYRSMNSIEEKEEPIVVEPIEEKKMPGRYMESIRRVTGANDRLIRDTWNTYHRGVKPLPGTIPYSVYICWRLIEELRYDEAEEN